MLPGPVFAAEMLTTARRRRYYAIRLLYGAILLVVLVQGYVSSSWSRGWGTAARRISPHELSALARELFLAFTVTQAITIGLLTPALVAGVVADEKQRKTLHYLLASTLSSGEIVLGKLAARLLHLGVFLAIGLPVLSLLTLFGGVDPGEVVLAYVGTGAGMFFLAGLSILVSTYSRKVRDAILLAFLLELAWLAIPPMIAHGLSGWRPNLYAWVQPVNAWALAAGPFALEPGPIHLLPVDWLMELWSLTGLTPLDPWSARLVCMVGLQLVYGAACVALAVGRLRPVFRSQEDQGRWATRLARWRWRLLPRPSCGDHPMLWKERHVSRLNGVTRLAVALVALGLFGFGVYWMLDLIGEAFQELASFGYGATGYAQAGARHRLHGALKVIGTILYIVMMLGVASISAGSVSSEREEDTWTSLLSTPLEGTEILLGKLIGAAWGLRWFALAMVLLWTVGLLAGAVHPLGFLAALIELVVFTWFSAALGTLLSLWSRTTTRSMAGTFGLLLFLNASYLLILAMARIYMPLMLIGCTPAIVAHSLLSFEDVWALLGFYSNVTSWNSFRSDQRGWELAMACVLSVLAHAGGALVLTLAAFASFDRVVDRPRRDPRGWAPPKRDRPHANDRAKEEEGEIV